MKSTVVLRLEQWECATHVLHYHVPRSQTHGPVFYRAGTQPFHVTATTNFNSHLVNLSKHDNLVHILGKGKKKIVEVTYFKLTINLRLFAHVEIKHHIP